MKILMNMIGVQFKLLMRDKMLILMSLGLALISMLVFGFAFGGDQAQAIPVGVVDLDKSPISTQLVDMMKKNDALKISTGELNGLLDEMKDGKLGAVVTLQPGFAAGLAGGKANVQFYVDDTDMIGAARSRGIVYGIFDAVGKQVSGYNDPVKVQEVQVTVRQQRAIDMLTPGMLGMSIMFANMQVGLALISWRDKGTLKRLSSTPLRAWQLISAQVVSQFVLSFLQAAVILAVAALCFGVTVKLEWLPVLSLFVIAGTFSIIGLGYAVANFARKQQTAQSMVMLISFPMMFLGGSYFAVNAPGVMGMVIDILPLTQLNKALRQIMVNGAGLDAVLLNLGALIITGVVLLALSIKTFRWNN